MTIIFYLFVVQAFCSDCKIENVGTFKTNEQCLAAAYDHNLAPDYRFFVCAPSNRTYEWLRFELRWEA